MSYNEITVGDKTVQGHRYIGGGLTDYKETTIHSTASDSFTTSADGILFVHAGRSAYGYTIGITVNGISAVNAYWDYGTGNMTCDMQLPIKKGDAIVIGTNLASPNTFYIIRYVSKYRS